MRRLTMSEINAMTRNITRCISALEDDDRITELLEMRHYIDSALKSIREFKRQEEPANA
jgi:hypothetical protein